MPSDLEAQAIHAAEQTGRSKWSSYAAAEAVDLVAELGLDLAGIYLDDWTWRAVFDRPDGERVLVELGEATRAMTAALSVRVAPNTVAHLTEPEARSLFGLTVVLDSTLPPNVIQLRDGDRILETKVVQSADVATQTEYDRTLAGQAAIAGAAWRRLWRAITAPIVSALTTRRPRDGRGG